MKVRLLPTYGIVKMTNSVYVSTKLGFCGIHYIVGEISIGSLCQIIYIVDLGDFLKLNL